MLLSIGDFFTCLDVRQLVWVNTRFVSQVANSRVFRSTDWFISYGVDRKYLFSFVGYCKCTSLMRKVIICQLLIFNFLFRSVWDSFILLCTTDVLWFNCLINRHANALLVKKWCIKSGLWHSIESSIGVLRLRKCNKMRYFLRKKVCTHHGCKTRSAEIKIRINLVRKTEKKNFFLSFLHGHV